jgi:hypothetical protein
MLMERGEILADGRRVSLFMPAGSRVEGEARFHSALKPSAIVLFPLLGCISLLVVSLPVFRFAPQSALVSSAETPVPASSLPFSFADTVRHLSETLGSAPRERRNDHAIFETVTGAETTLQVAVTQQDSQMLLRFFIEDEHGMNAVRDFCKAPFFLPEERDLLYELLLAGEGIRCAFMPRFDVLCEYDMRPERTLVSFLFSPPLRVCRVTPAKP